MDEKPSFIAEARREQIVNAAIQTLDEIGYVNASLAQIAKRAGISTALISYHFSDKNDLMNHVLTYLVQTSTAYILEKAHQGTSPHDQLNAFILASLAYQATHPAHNAALLEIVFNARTPDNIPYYKLEDDPDPLMQALQDILRQGQESGDFGTFNIDVMASMIQGAIGEYMLLNSPLTKKVDVETYGAELIRLVSRALAG
jgi:TetR/AcrR family transcriptional regulator, transcriptional repressor of bet genes